MDSRTDGSTTPARKLLHQIWLQGERAMPEEYRESVESWRSLHSGFRHRLWCEEEIASLVAQDYPELESLYHTYPHWVQRVDVGRYVILHKYGGTYTDVDSRCLIAIDELLELSSGELLIECDHHVDWWVGVIAERLLSVRRPWPIAAVNNSFLHAPEPRNPLLQFVLEQLPRHSRPGFIRFRPFYVSRSTGPIFLSRCLFECRFLERSIPYRVLSRSVLHRHRHHALSETWRKVGGRAAPAWTL